MHTSFVSEMSSASSARVGSSSFTPKMVQQMIMSTFSTLGIQGNCTTSNKFWLSDSATSNHMMTSSNNLCNVRPYHGTSKIQVANGSHLAIHEIGYINSSFKDVYVSHGLSTNLI